VERVEGKADASETALGNVPAALDMAGLESFDPERFKAATSVDPSQWSAEMKLHDEMLGKRLQGHAPPEIQKRYEELNKQFV
jgi:GTP-dependent phosphoenolpyruvate carboxykinase